MAAFEHRVCPGSTEELLPISEDAAVLGEEQKAE